MGGGADLKSYSRAGEGPQVARVAYSSDHRRAHSAVQALGSIDFPAQADQLSRRASGISETGQCRSDFRFFLAQSFPAKAFAALSTARQGGCLGGALVLVQPHLFEALGQPQRVFRVVQRGPAAQRARVVHGVQRPGGTRRGTQLPDVCVCLSGLLAELGSLERRHAGESRAARSIVALTQQS
jgi:hypothetical protein